MWVITYATLKFLVMGIFCPFWAATYLRDFNGLKNQHFELVAFNFCIFCSCQPKSIQVSSRSLAVRYDILKIP